MSADGGFTLRPMAVVRLRAQAVLMCRLLAIGLVVYSVADFARFVIYAVLEQGPVLPLDGWWWQYAMGEGVRAGAGVALWFMAPWLAIRLVPMPVRGRCPGCQYPLEASAARCPECGIVLRAEPPGLSADRAVAPGPDGGSSAGKIRS